MRWRLGLAGALAILLASAAFAVGCSEIERAKLHNRTDGPIVIRLRAEMRDGRDPGDVLVTLRPGEAKTLQGLASAS